MKILFVMSDMTCGGAQKSLLNLLNEINSYNFEIDLLLLRTDGEMMDQIPREVNILPSNKLVSRFTKASFSSREYLLSNDKLEFILKTMFVICKKLGLRNLFYNLILSGLKNSKHYDVVISFTGMRGIWDYFVLKKCTGDKKLVWIHNSPKALGINKDAILSFYNKFNKIINVSKTCKEELDSILPEIKEKSIVVYNLFNIKEINELALENNPLENDNSFKIITIARIDNHQKRIDRIIEVAKKLKDDGITDFRWYILGDGPDKDMLLNRSNELELKGIIEFCGFQSNPYSFIKNSNLFVLSSDFEGFGLVNIEARILNIPVVATDYNCAREFIIDGLTGSVVEKSAEGLHKEIKKILVDKEYYNKLKENTAKQGYSNDLGIEQFLNAVEYKT